MYSNSPKGLPLTITGTAAPTCSPVGQGQSDATTAGFTTTALCNDFTTSIPNSVGTGLSSNWLDCSMSSAISGAPWYWGFGLFAGRGSQPPCTGHVAWNVTDTGGGGNLALQFSLSDSDITNFGWPAVGMTSANFTTSNPVPGPGEYGYAYYEWTFRNDNNATGGFNNAFWSWVSGNAEALSGQTNYLLELDFTESYAWVGSPITDAGLNFWGPGGDLATRVYSQNQGVPYSSYHTWGALFTGDGGNNFSICSYVDGVRITCQPLSYSDGGAGEHLQRRYLMAWITNGASPAGPFGTAHQYIKSIKVLTCAKWTNADATGMCPGTTFNGSFYQ